MKKKISILKNRSVIRICGKDNLLFLNNIISNDLKKINNKNIFVSTLLSPQGKILFDFFISKNNKDYLIECSSEQLNELIKKLKLYSLRLDIDIREENFHVFVSNYFIQDQFTRKDIRFKDLKIYRHFSKSKNSLFNLISSEWYEKLKFKYKCPEGGLEIPTNKLYPFEISVIYENAIDFNKGCFIGQEVVARVKYKGSAKKKYISLKINSPNSIDNDNIYDINKKLVGSLIYNSKICENVFGFGLIKVEHIQNNLELICNKFKAYILD